ncbi:rhomboid family protein [Nitzschia inconspicua]|uniref:Rhomboid family protein n=1 Tax=Nitzschia inconspicua TaxID=303405 RepID=A0A9K3LRZ3_9STRA|nr:rhomboid family protein [Nitzschia inconspicua]
MLFEGYLVPTDTRHTPRTFSSILQRIITNGFNVPLGMLGFVVLCTSIHLYTIALIAKPTITTIRTSPTEKTIIISPSHELSNSFKEQYSLRIKTMLERNEWYRMVTSHFLHSDIIHLFNNMLATYAYGFEFESKFGTMRLLEGTVWAIVMSNIAVMLTMWIFPTIRQHDVPILGFSEVLYFWMIVVKLSTVQTSKVSTLLGLTWTMVGRDIFDALVLNKTGALFHLLGFVNGYIYTNWIRPRCSLPWEWLATIENIMDALVEFGCASLRLKGGDGGPYVVESAPM